MHWIRYLMGPTHQIPDSGFTLVEVLVATGLFGVLAFFTAMVTVACIKNLQKASLRSSREQIVTQLRSTVFKKKAIVTSITKKQDNVLVNPELYNCVCGVGTCTNMKQPFSTLNLYHPSGDVMSPGFFDTSGLPCNATNANCLLRVTTQFFAQCKPDLTAGNQNPPASCDGTPAEFITIMYTVDQNPDAVGSLIQMKPLSAPIYFQVADLTSEAGVCP